MDLNFKTNFVGKDGFVWWVGQIPNQESWQTQIDEGKGSWYWFICMQENCTSSWRKNMGCI